MSTQVELQDEPKLAKKDFVPPVDVRWCPGCGDYAILNSIQKVFPELGIPREKFVVVSGIGCSSRFPYYMNTYGFHTIHGRAPSVATGIKVANPDLSVWLVTGDGDGLSIGGNHLMHILRRNVNVNILMFNNKIYGLTKGQYSPTSEMGKVTKSSPYGAPDAPMNPASFALASEATFVARTVDTNPKHMQDVFTAAANHNGVSFVEILQNCVIFNDEAWENVVGRTVRDDHSLMIENGKPLLFGKDLKKGIKLNGTHPEVVTLGENGITEADIAIHNEASFDPGYAYMLSKMSFPDYPLPLGIFRNVQGKPTYEEILKEQRTKAVQTNGQGNFWNLLKGKESWEVEAK